MWPNVTQFETRQIELEAKLRLYGEREALAQQRLAAARQTGVQPRSAWFRRLGLRRRLPAGGCRA
jgi:hypothetical protein